MPTSQKAPVAQHDELLDKLDKGYPPAWTPAEAGETIVGVLARVESGMTKFGAAPIMILVDDQGGEHSVWIFYESLKSELRRAQPVPGERVAVRYEGEKAVKNPTANRASSYHAYRVAVDRPVENETVSWDSVLGGEPTAPAAPAVEPDPADPDGDLPF